MGEAKKEKENECYTCSILSGRPMEGDLEWMVEFWKVKIDVEGAFQGS